jgi:hypothetical protein
VGTNWGFRYLGSATSRCKGYMGVRARQSVQNLSNIVTGNCKKTNKTGPPPHKDKLWGGKVPSAEA